jgi:ketosteroid isomerase-like protein
MSQENVAIVKAAFAAWNEGRMDDLRDLYDPGAMIVTAPEDWPTGYRDRAKALEAVGLSEQDAARSTDDVSNGAR